MHILIVGNPMASGGDALGLMEDLKMRLEKRGHGVTLYLTKYAGDGEGMMGRIPPAIDRVVIVGGDGTVNEIINGIPDNVSIPICQWPVGNANLLGKSLDLPDKAAEVADLVETGRVVMADVGVMNGRKFIMVAGAGFDARVTEEVKKVRKGKVSNLSYIIPIFKALGTRSRYTVQVDDHPPVTGAVVLVFNVKNYAGLCELAVDAGVETRSLEVIVIPGDTLFSLAGYFLSSLLFRGRPLPGVSYFKGRHIRITAHGASVPVELDGDFNGRYGEVRIDLDTRKIPLVCRTR